MSTWKVILATLVIFAAGAMTGGLVVRSLSPEPVNFKPEWVRTNVVRRLTEQLELNPDQRKKVDGILQESGERTKLLWEFVGPYFHDEYRELLDDLNAVLTPAQRKKFEELRKLQRQRTSGPRQSSDWWRLPKDRGGRPGASPAGSTEMPKRGKSDRTNARPEQPAPAAGANPATPIPAPPPESRPEPSPTAPK